MATESLTLHDIVPGRVIADRYTVVGPNRLGGFSTAFEVVDAADENRCELQLFPVGLFESDGQLSQFCERLRPWESVHATSVLGVRAVLQLDAGGLAFVTDFPEGESLRARLDRDKSLTREGVLSIGCAVLEGLEAVHSRGLVHGDIKPHTIFVEGNGEETKALLVDGGVTPGLWMAKDLGEKTALIGTPYYAPVEQFGGEAPDVRSDIYNIATVLYECTTGVLPWRGRSFLEIFQQKLTDPPPMRERAPDIQVDAELDQAIRAGCCADRRARYQTAADFRAALEPLR